jgi:hypothetical protein
MRIHGDGSVSFPPHSDDALPPGTELPSDLKPQSTGTIDPLAPEPFVPSEPVASAEEGQTIVLTYFPYTENNWGQTYSPSLLQRSNELANKIWPTDEAYSLANGRLGYSGRYFDPKGPKKLEVIMGNKRYFDRGGLQAELQRALGFHQNRPMDESPFMFTTRARQVIGKLQRLEKKYGEDELFSDDTHDRIIETVLMPLSTFGVSDNFHSTNWLDLRNHIQKAVVNEILTKEDMQVMETILNYLPRLRSLLKDYVPHMSGYTKEDLLVPLIGNTAPGAQQRYVTVEEDRKLLNTVKKVLHFAEQSIPSNVMGDFIPSMRYPRKSSDAHVSLQKTSRELREASMDYVQGSGNLSKVLDNIVDLSEGLLKYFSAMADEIQDFYIYLDRVNVEYAQVVEESAEQIAQSDMPW